MPRSVKEAGLAHAEAPLAQMAQVLVALATGAQGRSI
jgi:chemotaxis response regulator CheB